jgi:site-specific DNA-methyltransferase (adenine-specific)
VSVYYQDDYVTLYHEDCLEDQNWKFADVLIMDPPYGRAWKQGDTGKGRGWANDSHSGIANDSTTHARDAVLSIWGKKKPALSFGDLMLPPPSGTKHVLIYDKGNDAGFTGAVGGYRRNVEAIYLLGKWGSGLGGRSAIVSTGKSAGGNLARTTGHPHTKPGDVMETLIDAAPAGVIADPFAGSGSTLVAAKALGRKVIGVELEERYCEIIAKRCAQEVLDFRMSA